jgi:hypothetical protein
MPLINYTNGHFNIEGAEPHDATVSVICNAIETFMNSIHEIFNSR